MGKGEFGLNLRDSLLALTISFVACYTVQDFLSDKHRNMVLQEANDRIERLEKNLEETKHLMSRQRDEQKEEISGLQTDIAVMQSSLNLKIRNELHSVINESAERTKKEALAGFSNAAEKTTDHVYGNPEARFSIYEYLDFDCPYCSQFSRTAKALVDKSNGKVNVVLRHFPLPMHGQDAKLKAVFTECIAEKEGTTAFLYAATALFSGVSTDSIIERLNLNADDITQCMGSEQGITGLLQGLAEGEKLQIDSTPTVFILDKQQNKRIQLPGTPSEAEITSVISRIAD